jgi:tetratricopeptide (TPR) repeat protein
VKDEVHYLTEAQSAYRQGRFEQGLRAYARVLEHNPRNTLAWSGQVRMLIELGEFQEAQVWADKALESLPNDPDLLAAKAVTLARLGDLKGAMAFSDAAIEEHGDTPYVWLARGEVLLARRERRADYCFEKALTLAAFDWFWLWLVARVHYYYSRFALALRHTQQALEQDAGHAVLWVQLGQCQLALGLAESARNSFEHAHQLDPACEESTRGLRAADNTGVLGRIRGLVRQLFRS